MNIDYKYLFKNRILNFGETNRLSFLYAFPYTPTVLPIFVQKNPALSSESKIKPLNSHISIAKSREMVYKGDKIVEGFRWIVAQVVSVCFRSSCSSDENGKPRVIGGRKATAPTFGNKRLRRAGLPKLNDCGRSETIVRCGESSHMTMSGFCFFVITVVSWENLSLFLSPLFRPVEDHVLMCLRSFPAPRYAINLHSERGFVCTAWDRGDSNVR